MQKYEKRKKIYGHMKVQEIGTHEGPKVLKKR
jgi:hypothetical protein